MTDAVEVAIIVSIPPTIAGVWAIVLSMLNRSDLKAVKKSVDGTNTALLEKLGIKTEESAHAQGELAGRDFQRDVENGKK